MESFELDRWISQIAKTEAEEISCSDCLDMVSEFVEKELAGETADERLARVGQHLGQCRVCREEYEVLKELVELDERGETPSIDDLKKSFE
ncbi:MAG: hypothetical protein ACM3JD_09735 [Rudaea sp.]